MKTKLNEKSLRHMNEKSLRHIKDEVSHVMHHHSHPHRTRNVALAVIPVFLIWLYLCWVAVLFGAEIVAARAEWREQEAAALET